MASFSASTCLFSFLLFLQTYNTFGSDTEKIQWVVEPQSVYYFIKSDPVRFTCVAKGAVKVSVFCDDDPLAASEYRTTSRGDLVNLTMDFTQQRPELLQQKCFCRAFALTHTSDSSSAEFQQATLKRDFPHQPISEEVEVGKSVELACSPPDGNPLPSVSWTKDGTSINFTTQPNYMLTPKGALIIHQVSMNDSGSYVCVASNIAATRLSMTAQLTVSVKGQWSSWGEWSPCSQQCGVGTMSRARHCISAYQKAPLSPEYCSENHPKEGQGRLVTPAGDETGEIQHAACTKMCPLDGGWGEWSGWSSCGVSCVQFRNRPCDSPAPAHGGSPCKGSPYQSQNCSTGLCGKQDIYREISGGAYGEGAGADGGSSGGKGSKRMPRQEVITYVIGIVGLALFVAVAIIATFYFSGGGGSGPKARRHRNTITAYSLEAHTYPTLAYTTSDRLYRYKNGSVTYLLTDAGTGAGYGANESEPGRGRGRGHHNHTLLLHPPCGGGGSLVNYQTLSNVSSTPCKSSVYHFSPQSPSIANPTSPPALPGYPSVSPNSVPAIGCGAAPGIAPVVSAPLPLPVPPTYGPPSPNHYARIEETALIKGSVTAPNMIRMQDDAMPGNVSHHDSSRESSTDWSTPPPPLNIPHQLWSLLPPEVDVATEVAMGVVGFAGGRLSLPEAGVDMLVPEGAIHPGRSQEMFLLCSKHVPEVYPTMGDLGEILVSPVVYAGPSFAAGAQGFSKSLMLNIAHTMENVSQWNTTLHLQEYGQPWKVADRSSNLVTHLQPNSAHIVARSLQYKYCLTGRPKEKWASMKVQLAVFCPVLRDPNTFPLRVYLIANTRSALSKVIWEESKLRGFLVAEPSVITVRYQPIASSDKAASVINLALHDLCPEWGVIMRQHTMEIPVTSLLDTNRELNFHASFYLECPEWGAGDWGCGGGMPPLPPVTCQINVSAPSPNSASPVNQQIHLAIPPYKRVPVALAQEEYAYLSGGCGTTPQGGGEYSSVSDYAPPSSCPGASPKGSQSGHGDSSSKVFKLPTFLRAALAESLATSWQTLAHLLQFESSVIEHLGANEICPIEGVLNLCEAMRNVPQLSAALSHLGRPDLANLIDIELETTNKSTLL